MKSTIIFVAALFTSAAIASANPQLSEEQYRAKYGRYSPAHEKRLKSTQAANAQDPAVCCRSIHSPGQIPDSEARYRAKYGVNSPAEEARQNAAQKELAAHLAKCVELGECPRMPVLESAAAPVSPIEARLQAKYGLPAKRPEPVQPAAPCEHACCQHGQ